MITDFASSYVGHLDLENVGYKGTPINDRFYSNEQLAHAFTKMENQAKAMDRLGYHSFWMAEHHFQPEGTECLPNIILVAMHLVNITKNLKIGTGFNIVPMWHPLRLAEDYAVADILSKGRVIFGVGRGYHTREVETFGSPLIDQEANREMFEEGVELIFKAFNNERFSHKGKFFTCPPEVPYRGYTLKELTLVPRPLRLPVETWQPIQGGTMRALEFMAKHGIQGMVGGGSAEGGIMDRVVNNWIAAHKTYGVDLIPGERLAVGFQFHIAKTKEQAIKEAAPYYEENMKMFGELRLARGITDEQIEAMRDPSKVDSVKMPRIEEAVENGGFLAGTPDDILEQLKKVEARLPGLKRVTVNQPLSLPGSMCLEQLEWFAKDVMPHFGK